MLGQTNNEALILSMSLFLLIYSTELSLVMEKASWTLNSVTCTSWMAVQEDFQFVTLNSDIYFLTEYYRSVTIVTNPERGFLNHQITHFHRQVPRF